MANLIRRVGFFVLVSLTVVLAQSPAPAANPATGPAIPSGLYDRIVANYFAGKWDDINADITAHIKDIAALPAAQKADVDYIRKAMVECRPVWWKPTKAGAPIRFRPVVWGQTYSAAYEPEAGDDPEHKRNIAINFVNGVPAITVRWNAKDMDDPTVVGELPFNKGETLDVNLWNTIGSAASWAGVPLSTERNMDKEATQILGRYLDFRGNLATAYYTTPRARRLAIWLSISAWSHEYDKVYNRIAHRTLGILLNEEVMAHPEIYTTLPRPKQPEVAQAESSMIWEIQEYLRGHDLSLAEEKSFREAVKAFAAKNEIQVRATQKAVLPNGLFFSLDPAADKDLEKQRDAWIKAQYAKKPDGRTPKAETNPKPE